jgi:hypothetical protein
MAKITFKGITQNSSISKTLTDEEFASIKEEYYKKPDFELVKSQLKSIFNGGVKMNHIYDYYFKEVMSKCVGTRASWSIWDGIHNREIMEYFAGKVDSNKKVFPDSMSLAKKIETAFRLCGIRYCVKLPNFPLKVASEIIKKYNVNGNYYDYSCGWGTRLLGSLQNNINYFGTDPNDELVPMLRSLYNDFTCVNLNNTSTCKIRCHGSQRFVEEWKGKMGLCFSSPPYFSLEDYGIGDEQSYKRGMTYQEWRDGYIPQTVRNCHDYLVPGGYFIFNVKSFKDYKTKEIYPLEQDFFSEALKAGFHHVETEAMVNNKRCHGAAQGGQYSDGGKIMFSDNDERMHVFQKHC